MEANNQVAQAEPSDATKAFDAVIDGLSVAAIFVSNLARVAALLQAAQAAGRALTDDEIAQARAITAAKRAMLEAS